MTGGHSPGVCQPRPSWYTGTETRCPLPAVKEWIRVLTHARLVVISDAGHYPHAEQPGQFFPAVEAFLAEAD